MSKREKKTAKKGKPEMTRRAAPKPIAPPKAEKRQRRSMDDLEQENEKLRGQVAELTKENDTLAAHVEELRGKIETGSVDPAKTKWKRGKLPGEKYIKTDLDTGKFTVIDKQEWDSLA